MEESNSLQSISASPLLFNKLLEQINKDFQMVGLAEAYLTPFPLNLYDCEARLQAAVRDANNHTPELIKALMYRIDVSEQALSDVLSEPGTNSFEERVAKMILHREAHKVLLKQTYGK